MIIIQKRLRIMKKPKWLYDRIFGDGTEGARKDKRSDEIIG